MAAICDGSSPLCSRWYSSQLVLVQHQLAARFVELRRQELVRAFGQHFAIAQALVDEQRRQPLGHAHRDPRVAGLVADAERVALDDVDADVARAHPLDDVFHQLLVGALLRIQVEVRDDLLEPGAAEDLLADRLQAILDARGHRRARRSSPARAAAPPGSASRSDTGSAAS